MRSPGFSQVCPAGSTRDPSRGQKIGCHCHIENLHANELFFEKNDGKDALSSPSRSNHVDVMRCVDCLRMFVGIFAKLCFLGEWSFKGHVLVVTLAPNSHPAKIHKHLQYICSVPSTSLGTLSRRKKKSCGNALGLTYPHWSTKRKRAIMIYGVSCVPGAGFCAATCVIILIHAERKAKSKVFHVTANFEY